MSTISPPLLFRPIREEDLAGLNRLVGTIADGLTTLPNDPDFLEHRIHEARRALDSRIRKPGGETYLFVLEDMENGGIVGTSGLLSRVGGFDPFYTYQLRTEQRRYEPLQIEVELASLHLLRNHKGPTEICSLFLHPDYRGGANGKLLSLARFCFLKAFPERFDKDIIAELRGYIDANGRSPFWEAVGKKFFQKDYYTADILSGVGEKEFIEALMPSFPIYMNLLPDSARSVVGKVHPGTEPARKILLREGFRETDEVDIFDAGPLLRAPREELRSWKATRTGPAVEGIPGGRVCLLGNGKLDFRALIAAAEFHPEKGITVEPATLRALDLAEGEELQILDL